MALNLVRNSRVFFTTNVSSTTGVVGSTGFDNADTFEIQVLDGFSFSQNTTTETVTLNEAGDTPSRGQRAFNTALEPVEFTFSTYIRPKLSTDVICEESVLWSAFATGRGATDGWTAGTPSVLSFANSNRHQLKSFGMIMLVDNVAYLIDNCALDQATIDFGLDAIATIAWTGRGTAIRQLTNVALDGTGTFTGGGLTGAVKVKDTTAGYLANKLSTVAMVKGINGGGTAYSVPITGGSITFANNLTYLTPANLGTVNTPVTYFTGTRAITGSLTAYLRTGGTDTGAILNDLLTGSATDVAPAYKTTIAIGGSANSNRVEIEVPAAMLAIPTVSAEQVVSTTINFTAHGFTDATTDTYNIEAANEASIRYYAA
jgi:hypothetical protein